MQITYPLDKNHGAVSDDFTDDYHHLWSSTYGQSEFKPEQNCQPHGQNQFPVDMSCCQAEDMKSAFMWYNANLKKCCPNGSTRLFGDLC